MGWYKVCKDLDVRNAKRIIEKLINEVNQYEWTKNRKKGDTIFS
jgi:hypothetical protein